MIGIKKCYVVHQNGCVVVRSDVMELLGLKQGENIDTRTFWKVIKLNSEISLKEIEDRINYIKTES